MKPSPHDCDEATFDDLDSTWRCVVCWSKLDNTPTPSCRSGALDNLRGWAIVLMVADHLLMLGSALGGPDWLHLPRQTITRLAMPIFLGLIGWLCSTHGLPRPRRLATIWLAGFWLTICSSATGMGSRLDLLCWVAPLVAFAGGWMVRYPLTSITVAMISVQVLGPADSYGYSPALLAVHFCIGVLAARYASTGTTPNLTPSTAALLRRTPWRVNWLGRHPLGAYVVHLTAIHALYLLAR